MPEFRMPGAFVEELAVFPPTVSEVETALPAFIGYTAQARLKKAGDLHRVPHRIRSLVEFEACYGAGSPLDVRRIDLDSAGNFVSAELAARYYLFDAVRLFFANGGSDCIVVSVGLFTPQAKAAVRALMNGLTAIANLDGPSIVLFPDAVMLGESSLGALQQAALGQCAQRQDRFAVFDLRAGDPGGASFRARSGTANLRYGAAYTPWLLVHPSRSPGYMQVRHRIFVGGNSTRLESLLADQKSREALARLETLCAAPVVSAVEMEVAENELQACSPIYRNLLAGIRTMTFQCPPSGAVVGVYARTDLERGVWKAPSNTVINGIAGLTGSFTEQQVNSLQVDAVGGKSINPIRQFPGRGWLVWGARTLAGNDNEWRYVPVRRLFITVETSLRAAIARFVFEPNEPNTWVRIRAMVENYLAIKWREGALFGARTDHAFFVRCGLGETMTAQDIADGRLVVEIGMAVAKPAEFIILRITQLLQEA